MTVETRRDAADAAGERRARTVDRDAAVEAVRALLIAVGEDPARPGVTRTPERVADLYLEMFSGIGVDPATALGAPVALTENDGPGELVQLLGIPFRSVCEHHLLAFEGTADVSYAPRNHIAGLSRIVRLVETAARRPTLQERLGQQIADALMAGLAPHGVTVRLEARHGCVAQLEPAAADTRVVTVASAGAMPSVAAAS